MRRYKRREKRKKKSLKKYTNVNKPGDSMYGISRILFLRIFHLEYVQIFYLYILNEEFCWGGNNGYITLIFMIQKSRILLFFNSMIIIFIWSLRENTWPNTETVTPGATSSQIGVTSPYNISLMGKKYNYNYEWMNWYINSASLIRGINQWPSGRVSASAYCGCWFEPQWWRSRCALLMRPNKVEAAVQCSVCHE